MSAGPMGETRATLGLTRLGELTLAFSHEDIHRVADACPPESDCLDLAELFELPPAPADEAPRYLQIRGGERSTWLRVGPEIKIRELPLHQVSRLPAFLAEGLSRRGICGVVRLRPELALLVDVERLLSPTSAPDA